MNSIEFNNLLRLIHDNPTALKKLYDFYFPKIIYHIGKKYGRSLAEDVAIEFFEWLVEHNVKEYVYSPTTWINIKCESIAKKQISNEKRFHYYNVEIPDEDVISKEVLYGDLYEVIKDLPELDQKIIEYHYWEGYKLKEIAVILNENYDVIKQRHKRLLSKLKKILSNVTFLSKERN